LQEEGAAQPLATLASGGGSSTTAATLRLGCKAVAASRVKIVVVRWGATLWTTASLGVVNKHENS